MVTSRRPYHHGDLRNALIAAGAKLAEDGGREAVGVRAVARAVGVTPTAAYRHFANAEELQEAVRARAFEAMVARMQRELATLVPTNDEKEDAIRQLEAVGRGYLAFAINEPGLFRTAFNEGGATLPTDYLQHAPGGFGILVTALDNLVAVGYLPPDRRPLAEFVAWAAVHGLARLTLDGPLAALPDEVREAVFERTIQMVIRGV